MKKVLSVFLAIVMLVMLSSCTTRVTDKKLQNAGEIVAFYSIKSTEDDFIVEVQDLGGVYTELYDEDGLYIKFAKGAEIVDSDGNAVSPDKINIGATLKIAYDGTLKKDNPKTIEAYKITIVA